jgi:predicted N-acetyltransferase YhbS
VRRVTSGTDVGWTFVGADATREPMNDVSLTILAETKDDAAAIERLHERTFGPGRYAKTAYRLREQVDHALDVSFTARIGTLLVGSVRLSPVRIGEAKVLLLGPLTVEPAFRERGVGQSLIERAFQEARAKGHRLVILVGDEPYYGKSGFRRVPAGRVMMPGPVDPARLLVAELVDGAFEGVSGAVRGEWDGAQS